MKRLYFLAGPPADARIVISALREAGVASENIHALAREEQVADRIGARPATMDEYTDVGTSRTRGTLTGGAAGLLAGLAATVIPGGLVLGGAAIALAGAAGATLGFTISSIIGGSEEHPVFKEYESRLEKGEVLVAVDTDEQDTSRVADTIHGVDSSIKVEERKLTHVEQID